MEMKENATDQTGNGLLYRSEKVSSAIDKGPKDEQDVPNIGG